MKHYLTIISIFLFLWSSAQKNNFDELVRIKYNHPGLITDLGVGLWAWPFPMDYDHDGDLDLLVNCPDHPFNGLWFFENKTGGNEPVFQPPGKLTGSQRNLQISKINGEYKVMLPGVAFPHFFDTFFEQPDTLFQESFYKSIVKKPRFNLWRYVDYDGDGDLDITIAIDDWLDYGWDNAFNAKGEWTNGPLHGAIYLVEQTRRGKYAAPKPIEAGGKDIDTYGISGANFNDFDGDGDLDIITGEFVDRLTWFENIGTRKRPEYAAGKFIKMDGKVLHLDLEMIVPNAIDWDGNGTVDLIVGEEDGRVVLMKNKGKKNRGGAVV